MSSATSLATRFSAPPSPATSRPPCLLTMPTYGGTLAAARSLGALGAEVTVAGQGLLAPARWSRATTRFERCPPPREPQAFLEWLLAFGRRNPGHFLYPTSDDLAWLFTRHAGVLKKHFLLFQPPLQTLVTVLNKQRLHRACTDVGLPTVPTCFPESVEQVARLPSGLQRPLLLKPRTQVFLASQAKGSLVRPGDDLPALYRRWMERNGYLPGPEKDFGAIAAPMLQEFWDPGPEGVHGLSGFVDRDGALLGIRASRKLLQRPRVAGVGLCFEDAPVDPALAARLVALCRHVGYHGVFEAEFLLRGGIHHLIDFNPRFYGQMHFDCARGLPLPVFPYLAALGDRVALREIADQAAACDSRGYRYAFRFGHRFIFRLRRMAGTSTAEEATRWARWMDGGVGPLVDPCHDPDDRAPGRVQALAELWGAVRHPRAYLRDSVLDRS